MHAASAGVDFETHSRGGAVRHPAVEGGTALLPTATSNPSRPSTRGDDRDAGDAQGRIDTRSCSAGGRKVAGSNPVAPTTRKPAREAGFRRLGVCANGPERAPWYQARYQAAAFPRIRVVARPSHPSEISGDPREGL